MMVALFGSVQKIFYKIVEITLNQNKSVHEAKSEKVPVTKFPIMPLWKRVLDISLIVVASPIILIVGGIMALVIKLGSRGPVIFCQQRIGYKGSVFTCYKFRTMFIGAETDSHQGYTSQLIKSGTPMTKLDAKNDPRVIPFGKIIRATGLDELPQLINVIKGEMSLVGPRPCIAYEYEMYENWQKRRFDAAPGLTGLWQVSGKNRTTFNQMINLDIEYSEQQSLLLDAKIISKTIPALMMQCYDQRVRSKSSRTVNMSPAVSSGVGKPVSSLNV